MKTTFFKKLLDPLAYLFWRTQIAILRACPPLCGVVSKYSLGAANSPLVWMKTLLQLAARTPHALFDHCSNRWHDRMVLARVTFLVTTRCTLNCDKCLSYIPDIKHHKDTPLDDMARDLENLLAGVDYIYAFIFTGGEAFLHPDLDQIIRLCADSGKIGSVSVQSNGTVIPGAKLLAALRETKTLVKISNYPNAQPDVEKLKRVLEGNDIRYTHISGTLWDDSGAFGQRQAGSEERRFGICVQQLCMPCFNGKLHRCATAAILMEEGRIPDCRDECVDLRTAIPTALRTQWNALMKKRSLTACSYCLGMTYKTPKIPVAVQRARK